MVQLSATKGQKQTRTSVGVSAEYGHAFVGWGLGRNELLRKGPELGREVHVLAERGGFR